MFRACGIMLANTALPRLGIRPHPLFLDLGRGLTLPSPFNAIVHSNTNKNVSSRSVRGCHLVTNKYLGSERGRHENHQIRHFSGFIKRLFNINWECGKMSSLLKHFKIKNWLNSYKCTSAHTTTYHLPCSCRSLGKLQIMISESVVLYLGFYKKYRCHVCTIQEHHKKTKGITRLETKL